MPFSSQHRFPNLMKSTILSTAAFLARKRVQPLSLSGGSQNLSLGKFPYGLGRDSRQFISMLNKICAQCTRLLVLSSRIRLPGHTPVRTSFVGKDLKRFYKNVSISQVEGGKFEVNLDRKKLKTPMGKLFQVPNEALALAVANEWNGQQDVIKRHTMHLTSLSNTAIDNPTHRSREVVINGILEFLDTDTICYRLEEPPELVDLQRQEWDPLLEWLKQRYGAVLHPTTGLGVPEIPEQTKDIFRQHLDSYNDWALVGYQHAVECIKSFVLTSAVVDRHISVEYAVALARLEQEFQTHKWGTVEWYHDIEEFNMRSRLAAGVLFVHLNSEETSTKTKQTRSTPV